MKKLEEMESLNLDDLDVDELERRLELAPTSAPGGGEGCGTNCTVDVKCSSNCQADLSWSC